jgi:hypothetical protein
LTFFAARHDPLCDVSKTGSIVNVLAPTARRNLRLSGVQ